MNSRHVPKEKEFLVTAAMNRLLVLALCLSFLSACGDGAKNANQLMVETAQLVQNAHHVWTSKPWTDGASLNSFLSMAAIRADSFGQFLAVRPRNELTDMKEALEEIAKLFRQAVNNLHAIQKRHPSSDLAVKLSTGQPIGDISLRDLENRVSQLQQVIQLVNRNID